MDMWTVKRMGYRWALVDPSGVIESAYEKFACAKEAARRLNHKGSFGSFVLSAGAL